MQGGTTGVFSYSFKRNLPGGFHPTGVLRLDVDLDGWLHILFGNKNGLRNTYLTLILVGFSPTTTVIPMGKERHVPFRHTRGRPTLGMCLFDVMCHNSVTIVVFCITIRTAVNSILSIPIHCNSGYSIPITFFQSQFIFFHFNFSPSISFNSNSICFISIFQFHL